MEHQTPTRTSGHAKTAVLVDFENISYALKAQHQRVEIAPLQEACRRFGTPLVFRAYADWQEQAHGRTAAALYAAGIEPVYVPVFQQCTDGGEVRRRNSVDIKMAIDAIDLSYRYSEIDTFILVSGDADFLHTVTSLHQHQKRVVLVSHSAALSTRLAAQVDELIIYDRDIVPPAAGLATTAACPPPSSGAELDSALVPVVDELLRATPPVDTYEPAALHRVAHECVALVRTYRGRGQELLLSRLGLELRHRCPDEFTRYAKGRLGAIAAALDSHGFVRRVERGNVIAIYLPNEAVPGPAVASAPAKAAEAACWSSEPAGERVALRELLPTSTNAALSAIVDAA